ncbi:MAG: AAA family ATPase [Actinobacteria bacterium]|nr:AAA family ATPase [Actinomycetota bacterium]
MENLVLIDSCLELKNNKVFPSKNPECCIISVISNKGGAGKTSIAITAGLCFAKELCKRTLLLEVDSSPGDFGAVFDIESEKSFELALRFPEKFGYYIKNIFKNLDAMKGVSDPLVAERIKETDVHKLFKFLTSEYDYIIIDTQTVINGTLLDVLRLSDVIMLVSEYSVESFSRISSLFYILTNKFAISKDKIKVIINKKRLFKLFKIWDFIKIAEFPIEAFISYDPKYGKSLFLFNKNKIFKTRLYKQLSKILFRLNGK